MPKASQSPKPSFLTEKVRAGIKASQGKLSQSATARKFGVSRRTVGRIFHGGELSTSGQSGPEVESLREQVAKLTELVTSLSKQVESHAPQQRLRPSLFWWLYNDEHKKWRLEGKSQIHFMPEYQEVKIKGLTLAKNMPWKELSGDHHFRLDNPASPGCTEYPYPQPVDPKERRRRYPQKTDLVFRDPQIGVVCDCKPCQEWRRGRAYEHILLRMMPYCMIDVSGDRR